MNSHCFTNLKEEYISTNSSLMVIGDLPVISQPCETIKAILIISSIQHSMLAQQPTLRIRLHRPKRRFKVSQSYWFIKDRNRGTKREQEKASSIEDWRREKRKKCYWRWRRSRCGNHWRRSRWWRYWGISIRIEDTYSCNGRNDGRWSRCTFNAHPLLIQLFEPKRHPYAQREIFEALNSAWCVVQKCNNLLWSCLRHPFACHFVSDF